MFRRPEALAVCPPGGDLRERGMFLNQTANYGLSQWEATDRILMEDFNSDNSKIDAALVNLAAQAAGFGNCQIYRTTYTGTGTAGENNPNTLSFPNIPVLVMIAGSGAIGFTGSGITYMICIQAGSSDFCYADWNEERKNCFLVHAERQRQGTVECKESGLSSYCVSVEMTIQQKGPRAQAREPF